MPDARPAARVGLSAFAAGLAARLPGHWTAAYREHADYQEQFPAVERLWDAGHVEHLVAQEVFGHEAVLHGPDGQRLYVNDRPKYRFSQFIVAALAPDDAHSPHFVGVTEPHGITVPGDPVRAAAQVARRLLPRYAHALHQLRYNIAAQPASAYAPARPVAPSPWSPTLPTHHRAADDPGTAPAAAYAFGRALAEVTDHLNGLDGAAAYTSASALLDQILHPDHGALEKIADLFEAAAEQAKESPSEDGWDLSADLEDAAVQMRDLVADLHLNQLVTRTRTLRPAPAVTARHAPAATLTGARPLPSLPAGPPGRTR